MGSDKIWCPRCSAAGRLPSGIVCPRCSGSQTVSAPQPAAPPENEGDIREVLEFIITKGSPEVAATFNGIAARLRELEEIAEKMAECTPPPACDCDGCSHRRTVFAEYAAYKQKHGGIT